MGYHRRDQFGVRIKKQICDKTLHFDLILQERKKERKKIINQSINQSINQTTKKQKQQKTN